MIPFISV